MPNIDYKEVSAAATHAWDAILPAMGVELRKTNKNGPCPICGGNDRAHFFERQGRIMNYCRQGCGNSGPSNEVSTPEHLLMTVNSWSFPQMVEAVADFLNVTPREQLDRYRVTSIAKAKKALTMPAHHIEDSEKSAEILARCALEPTHPYFLQNSTAPMDDCLTLKGKLIVKLLSDSGELVNLASLGGKAISYAAGGISYGATAIIPAQSESSGKTILCQDYADAWRIWWFQRGQSEARCAISAENFTWMIGRAKDQFTTIACYPADEGHYREVCDDVIIIDALYKQRA